MGNRSIAVEVVYALPERSWTVPLKMPDGATVGDAIRAADLAGKPGMEGRIAGIAVHGRLTTETTVLRDGDRIELLRALSVDPKQARRTRATKSGSD